MHVRSQGRGRTGDPDPHPENHKNIGFLSNTGPNPLENHKGTKPAFNFGLLSPTSETLFKIAFRCRAIDGRF